LLPLGQDQAGNVHPIGDLFLDVGRLEGGVTDASWLDHDWTPVAQLEWAAAGTDRCRFPRHHIAARQRALPCQASKVWRKLCGATESTNGRRRTWTATSSRPTRHPTVRAPGW